MMFAASAPLLFHSSGARGEEHKEYARYVVRRQVALR